MAESEAKRARATRKRALVTGASAGIGKAFAERLAADGFDLILVARNKDRLDELAERLAAEHGCTAEALPADLTDPLERSLVEGVIEDDCLDLLVNNAGFGTVGPFVAADADAEEREVQLNVIALTRLCRSALPGMIERGRGGIINVSSLAAFQPAPYTATYAATKAFVNSFTEALYEELRGTGVVVQALCPGFTRTEFQERAGVDVSRIPDMAWMESPAVVTASLAALGKRELICVPGWSNWALSSVSAAVPRSWSRRLAAFISKDMA